MTSIELRLLELEDRVKRMTRQLKVIDDKAANVQQQQNIGRGAANPSLGILKAKTTSTITARSSTTMGSGTADLYYKSGTNTLSTDSVSVTVLNEFGSSVSSGKYIYVAWVDDAYELIASEC